MGRVHGQLPDDRGGLGEERDHGTEGYGEVPAKKFIFHDQLSGIQVTWKRTSKMQILISHRASVRSLAPLLLYRPKQQALSQCPQPLHPMKASPHCQLALWTWHWVLFRWTFGKLMWTPESKVWRRGNLQKVLPFICNRFIPYPFLCDHRRSGFFHSERCAEISAQ